MATTLEMPKPAPRKSRTCRPAFVSIAATLLLISTLSGCSLFVMAGKMFFGDPGLQSDFRTATGVNLAKSDDPVIVICTAPHSITSRYPSIEVDLVERVIRRMRTRGLKVISPDDAADWLDDHGEWGDYSELANELDAGYIFHVDLRQFSHDVEGSDGLLQGRARGMMHGYAARANDNGHRMTSEVFIREFKVEFPDGYSIPSGSRSEDMFVQDFMNRLALRLGQMLYDHRASETIH